MTDISTTTSENIVTLGSNDEGSDLIAVTSMDENNTEDERNQSGIVLVGDQLVIVVLFLQHGLSVNTGCICSQKKVCG